MIKVNSQDAELCLPCGEQDDGVLVDRGGECSLCGREVESD